MRNPLSVRLGLLAILFLLFSSQTFSRAFYVSSSYTGSTSNGSLSTPWKSLANVQSSMSSFLPGDSILFKKGDKFSGNLNITRSGNSTNPIYFGSYGTGADPLFYGTGSHITYMFYTYNQSYIVFYGLNISDTTISATDRTIQAKIEIAFQFDGGSSYNVIRKCTLDRVGVGAYFTPSSGHHTLDSCDIGNMRMVRNTPTTQNNNDDYGANPTVISSAYNSVTHNYFHDCWATSFDYGYDGGAIEFFGNGTSNNFIGYNTFIDCNGTVEQGSSNGGIMENNVFAYNKVINDGKLFYINNSASTGFQVTVTNLQFYNNVIIESYVNRLRQSDLGSMAASSTASGIVVFKNNVFMLASGINLVRASQFNGTQLTHQNNVYKMSGGSSIGFTIGSTETSTTESFWTNTSNSNPLYWDYTPVSGSVLIDKGQNVGYTADYAGNAISGLPEAGILERSSGTVSPLNISATAGTISCNAQTTSVTVSATGGVQPYTGTGSYTVGAGTYSYTVTDAAGSSSTTNITVTEPTTINVVVSAGTIATNGGTTSVTVTATGGTGAKTYKLGGGSYQSSNIFSNVSAGTYTVVVKDANSCTQSQSFTLIEPAPAPLQLTSTSGSISCNGGSTTVTVSASGGVGPYSGTGTFTVSAGIHTYTVTDAAGSSQTASVTVTEPEAISVSSSAGTITNYGGTTYINISASGGAGGYTYRINGGTYQSSNSFTNVAAGNYTITVKDANSCTKSVNVILSQPSAALTVNATAGNINCNGESTTVTVTATGGSSPYQGTGTFTVVAGTYNYTVTDAYGNTETVSVIVTEPSSLNLSLSAGAITAFGGTTQITASATGGTGTYSYKINNGSFQSSATFSGIAAGTYTIIVKDANGCTQSSGITVSGPSSALGVNASAGTIDCNGGTTMVTVTGTGGTQPYSGEGSFTASAGTHSYSVTDANGNVATVSITIDEPSVLIVEATASEITVYGGTTSINVGVTGGTGPYSYKLNNGIYQSSNTFNSISAGNYSITVKDANGCTKSSSVIITQPSASLVANATTTGLISCNGGTTTVSVTATGGTAPYTGTGTFSVGAGAYAYTVVDANGNAASVSITVTEPAVLVATLSAGEIALAGGTTSIVVTAVGGTAPYNYKLGTGNYQSDNMFNNVQAGTYLITVKDASGCTTVESVTIIEPQTSSLTLSLKSKTDATCIGAADGTIDVLAAGGTAPYTYTLVDSITDQSGSQFTKLKAGNFTIIAKDASGNRSSLNVTILDGNVQCRIDVSSQSNLVLNAYPNPSTSFFNLSVTSVNKQDIFIDVTDMAGKRVYQTKGSPDLIYKFGQNLKSGMYVVRVRQTDKVSTLKIVKL